MKKRYLFWEVVAIALLLAIVIVLPVGIFAYQGWVADERYSGKTVRVVARNDNLPNKPGFWMVQQGRIWNYIDENQPNTLEVIEGEEITLLLTSVDTIHEFSIAGYDLSATVHPGKVTVKTFVAHNPGEFRIECTNFCGEGHEEMVGKVMVLPAGTHAVSTR
jgi:heme/copper-type cytochrome/quinol oxidase subunit 2